MKIQTCFNGKTLQSRPQSKYQKEIKGGQAYEQRKLAMMGIIWRLITNY